MTFTAFSDHIQWKIVLDNLVVKANKNDFESCTSLKAIQCITRPKKLQAHARTPRKVKKPEIPQKKHKGSH